MVKSAGISCFSLFLISLFFLVSCSDAPEITKKWQIEGEDFTLEFRKDSVYQLREGHKLQEGRWMLRNDTIFLKQADNNAIKSNFAIKKLTKQNLTVEYNGEEIDFIEADSILTNNKINNKSH